MVLVGPVTIGIPDWLSKEYLTGGLGVAGGLIFSDYIAASLISRTGWTAETALAGSAAAKIGLGAVLMYGATKMTDRTAKPLLGLASVGCFASVLIDGIRYAWPLVGGASARLEAAMRDTRLVSAGMGMVTLRVAPGVAPAGMPAGIALRAETPSGIALGGF